MNNPYLDLLIRSLLGAILILIVNSILVVFILWISALLC